MPSFSNKKQIRFVITLGTGNFGNTDNNQVILQGNRCTVDIDKAGAMQMGTMRAKIYGVRLQDMDAVTTLQWNYGTTLAHTVEVFAIDGLQEMLVFGGDIVNAWADVNSPPDVFLHIQARTGYKDSLRPMSPRSFNGPIDVASVMSQIAGDLGYAFENNGVDIKLNDVYLPNTGLEQARDLAKAANCDLYLEERTLAICRPGAPRKTLIPRISADSGLVGYPTFDGVGVNFRTLYNPSIVFGGAFELVTDVRRAAGQWVAASVSHQLSAELPSGPWHSTVRGNANGLAVVSR